jgi:hypothetical protein
VISEINYASDVPGQSENEQCDSDRYGAYMADLFTWITDHYAQNLDPATLAKYPLRVLWYSASDDIGGTQVSERPFLGLYQRASPPSGKISKRKTTSIQLYCPAYFGPRTHSTSGTIALDVLYTFLTTAACY